MVGGYDGCWLGVGMDEGGVEWCLGFVMRRKYICSIRPRLLWEMHLRLRLCLSFGGFDISIQYVLKKGICNCSIVFEIHYMYVGGSLGLRIGRGRDGEFYMA